jgi:tellurite resistance protein TehA-like permease
VKTRLADVNLSPDVFSSVMATGILSIAARNHPYSRISGTLAIVASLGLLILVALVLVTAAIKRRIVIWDVTDPDVTLRMFTFVAACAVLDSRVASHPVVARILGGVALSSWLVLIALTARNMSARRWAALRDHAQGAWELASVGTSGLAIVMAQAAPDWLAGSVRTVTVVTWVAATLWIAPLIYFGLHRISQRPEALRFGGVWWTVVFPLGMYSVATDAMAAELRLRSMQTVSLVFFWNALAAWLIVVVAGLLGFRHTVRR